MPINDFLIDEVEEPIHEISPSESVYSFFMFIAPAERKKEGRGLTCDTIMAWFLVIFSLSAQGILLNGVWGSVVEEEREWQSSILTQMFVREDKNTCNDGSSLCTLQNNGKFTCAPPTVQLSGRWDDLDLDGDGVWTLEEVHEARDELKCKYVIDPIEIFHVFVNVLKKREDLIWISPGVKAGKNIPKPYFDYAAGDINMCGYRNTDMCSNLFERGVFDAAFEHGTAPRVGTTVRSAMEYCWELLKTGGICDRELPSTYKVWKIASVKKCGISKYSKFQYEGPNNQTQSLLKVDYKTRQRYERYNGVKFTTYKTIIMCFLTGAMCLELKSIWVALNWCWMFPAKSNFDTVQEDVAESKTKVTWVLMHHKVAVFLVALSRIYMLAQLANIGFVFLHAQTGYIGLLLDGVAIIFILDIPVLVYTHNLRRQIHDQIDKMEPMKFPALGPTFMVKRHALRQMLWYLSICALSLGMCLYYRDTVATPLYHALSCTCFGEGEHCHEASRFDRNYWSRYWKETVPSSIAAINALKETAEKKSESTELVSTLLRLGRGSNHYRLKP